MAKKSARTKAMERGAAGSSQAVATPFHDTPRQRGSGRERPVQEDRGAAPAAALLPEPDAPATFTEADPRFWHIALALLVVGIALRQYRLMEFPYHPDEAIHAWFAFNFRDYHYDPIYHGPLLYHLTASVFALLGANDFTARLVPSIMGVVLLWMVLGPARRWLGARAALWSLGLLAISPVMVAYQRRLLHDALVLVLTLGAVLCFQAAREQPPHTEAGRSARAGLAVLLTLFVATKANSFFIIAMLASFWIGVALPRWWARRQGRAPGGDPVPDDGWMARIESLAPLALLLVVSVASYFALRDPGEVQRARDAHNFVLNEKQFTGICLIVVMVMWVWLVTPAPEESPRGEELYDGVETDDANAVPRRVRSWHTYLLTGWLSVFLFAFLFGHGFLWWKLPVDLVRHPGEALPSTVASLKDIRDVVLWRSPRTALQRASDWGDVVDALPKCWDYWRGQQSKPRLPGRHDYYIVLMALYELPIIIVGLCGIVRASRQRSAFTDLLLWWAFTSFVLYAIANEKVPWLLCHIMLPFALLGGWWLAQLPLERPAQRWTLGLASVAGAIFLLRGVVATNFERAADNHEPLLYAQTTEAYRDKFFAALSQTAGQPGTIWMHTEKQWPAAWYLRAGAPWVASSGISYAAVPGNEQFRMAVSTVEEWPKQRKRFAGWKSDTVDYFIWPRASWPALQPARYVNFWLHRGATVENGILAAPGEWSAVPAVVATPP